MDRGTVVEDVRVWAGGLEDLQHTAAGGVPHLRTELLPVQNHQVLQTVGPRSSQLLIVCTGNIKPLGSCRYMQVLPLY